MYKDLNVAVTGANGGIGRGIAEMFIREGAKVAISDLVAPEATATEIGAKAFACDVSSEESVLKFINDAEAELGSIDIYISNAGVGYSDGKDGLVTGGSNKSWDVSWGVNVMGSVYASRALFPKWIERGSGHFVITASAAGLLNQIGSASYSATKHAAVGLAEAMYITHKADGINVYCICPQYIRSNMTKGQKFAENSKDGLLEPSDVANALSAAMQSGNFMVLSHPIVKDYFMAKAHDYNGWVDNMVRLKSKINPKDLPLKHMDT